MPRRQDIKKVLILGSGPIVIGQACEFDYSGTQACKALMKEGLEVILVNSNPATIMTDPELATKVYIEPLKLPFLEKIIAKEKPDSIIPTLGGQTALNAALELDRAGILKKYDVKMLGTSSEVILKAEDRDLFKKVLEKVGAKACKSVLVRNFEEAIREVEKLNFPIILRPNFTLGGSGGGVTYSLEEYRAKVFDALAESPTSEVLVEESLLGWKEFELEVMRDADGTFVVVCSIENIDPCGVHTGDSITVAPQQTLSDREYQEMRDEAKAIIEEVGIETGGANIQFAVNPENGERIVIEMNPRVSRSSALASKATGFPIAKLAALVALGYRLEELKNDITQTTPCCYEPALDYVVTKIPRFAFEKFQGTKDQLNTQMKSVGEVMGIGRTFKESFLKAVHSLEKKESGLGPVNVSEEMISYPNSQRMYHLFQAMREGYTIDKLYQLTRITPWFLEQFQDLINLEDRAREMESIDKDFLLECKRSGFSDVQLSRLSKISLAEIQEFRDKENLRPGFFRVDTCAGEFASDTPYYYSTYWTDPTESSLTDCVVVIGSGPNRIGQGIEFDYGCVRAVKAFQREGNAVVMINSNPETVSTDYDTSNALFFEPLTPEFVGEVLKFVKPKGVATQWGGQTSLSLVPNIEELGYQLLGSSRESIDLSEDRGRFGRICSDLNFLMPKAGMAGNLREALEVTHKLTYPILCRPSYVLGGSRMEVIENEDELRDYFERYGNSFSPSSPVLIDEFLDGALEVDVDLIRSKDWSVIGGIVEHIEAAGVHSGDSMGVLPPQRLKDSTCAKIEQMSLQLAEKLDVIGHLNLQLAIKNDQVFILEANPRSSRSVPFVAKASGVPLVDLAVKAMLGLPISRKYEWKSREGVNVKGVVFPFKKFPEADAILGPEMKSTGESMGRGADYSEALLKAFLSAQSKLPMEGEVFLSLRDKDKELLLPLVEELHSIGFRISTTFGTGQFLCDNDIPCIFVRKVYEGRPHCVDRIRSGKVQLVINTTSGKKAIENSFEIRRSCIDFSIPCITESHAAEAFLLALKKARSGEFGVEPLPANQSL
ncbi:MAG: carbamoyl-phosphate synthase large subunit [Bdellovibrionales bacterium]|nr:carbamoyl-phosphate synthase large subunit [Bdellovibrionales bacterium]